MSALTEKLAKEHAAIAATLEKVQAAGITSKEGQELLLAVKNNLLDHLATEDRELYPVLRRAAEKDENLARSLRVFAEDLEGVSKAALDFFSKYAAGGSGIDFVRDVAKFFVALRERIAKEEGVLYKAYDKYSA